METRTVGCEGRMEGLTQGEEEGIEADVAAVWNLCDEPLRDVADRDWGRSHRRDRGSGVI